MAVYVTLLYNLYPNHVNKAIRLCLRFVTRRTSSVEMIETRTINDDVGQRSEIDLRRGPQGIAPL